MERDKIGKKKKMREVIAKQDAVDKRMWTIPKGTRLYVFDEIINPMSKKKELFVLIDNGTGMKALMPKTVVEAELVE